MSDIKEKILKLADERKEWEKGKDLLVGKVNVLKEKQYVMEKEIEDKNKEDEIHVI